MPSATANAELIAVMWKPRRIAALSIGESLLRVRYQTRHRLRSPPPTSMHLTANVFAPSRSDLALRLIEDDVAITAVGEAHSLSSIDFSPR